MGAAACVGMDCCDGYNLIHDNAESSLAKCRPTVVVPRIRSKRRPVRLRRRKIDRDTNERTPDILSGKSILQDHPCQVLYANNQIYQSDGNHQQHPPRLQPLFMSLPEIPQNLM